MAVLAVLLPWLALLAVCRLPLWRQQQQCGSSAAKLALSVKTLRWALIYQRSFQIIYLLGLLVLLLPLLQLGWQDPLWLGRLPLVAQLAGLILAFLATINLQGLLMQLAAWYRRSHYYYLLPQRTAATASPLTQQTSIWIYLPVLMEELVFRAVLLYALQEIIPELLAILLSALLLVLLKFLGQGAKLGLLLGVLLLSLSNGLLLLAQVSILLPMINCVLYLLWLKFYIVGRAK